MKKWDDFVYQTVNRYKARNHWWIPANEPNLSKYWHPKPDAKAYVNLLKVTRKAVLRADPKAKILGCNVAGMDLLFLEGCFKEGVLSYCDAIGVHPYICPHSPDERMPVNILDPMSPAGNFRDGLILAKKLIEKYGGKQKLWLDEAGQPHRDDFIIPNWGVSEEKAAEYLVKIYSESLASGAVERVLWFSFWEGYPHYNRQAHHTDKIRRSAWRIVCSGGYFASGFGGTTGHSDFWVKIDPESKYTFVIKDEGAAHQLSLLYDFFLNLPFWRMQPYDSIEGDAVAMAEIGKVYVIYMPKGGNIAVGLTQAKGDLIARWFNPRYGEWADIGVISGGMTKEFNAPDENDWVLYIRMTEGEI